MDPATRPSRRAHGEDLLAQGVERFFAPAVLESPAGAYARITQDLGGPAPSALGALTALGGGAPRRDGGPSAEPFPWAIIDIESLGFIGRPLFLIGALHARGVGALRAAPHGARSDAPTLEIVQYLARDYSEEEAVVQAFASEIRATPLWITFNGRTFDLPFLRARAAFYRRPLPGPEWHVDLLPLARRLWGAELPDCRLQTLERRICRRGRGEEIPGARIPEAYHRFVGTGEPDEMITILRHNRADLLGLLELLRRALAAAGAGGDAESCDRAQRNH